MIVDIKNAIITTTYKVNENLDLKELNLNEEDVKNVDYIEVIDIDWKRVKNKLKEKDYK